jgi:hypothetical protein
MQQQQFEAYLADILKGDWQAKEKLWQYFDNNEKTNPSAILGYQQQAFQYFSRAASKNNPYAIAFLGVLYYKGWGTLKNISQAVILYRTAVERYNNPWGQNYLGNRYYYGRGVAKSYQEAVRLYQLAANQGDPDGQYSLGWMLEKGEGVTPNSIEAKRWYQLAADNGNTGALNILCKDRNFYGCNPFNRYVPKNKQIRYSVEDNSRTEVSGSVFQDQETVSSSKVVDNHYIVIKYTGAINIGDRTVLKKFMPNYYSKFWWEAYRSVPCEGFCCFISQKEMALEEACERAKLSYENDIASAIQEADELITQRIAEVQGASQGFALPSVLSTSQGSGSNPSSAIISQSGTVTLTIDQLNELLRQQSAQNQAREPAVGERSPLLFSSSNQGGSAAFFQPAQTSSTSSSSIFSQNQLG